MPVLLTAGDGASVEKMPELALGSRPAPMRPSLFFYLGSGLADPVEEALDDAQAALRRGLEHYQAGDLEQARSEFDYAVDLLLLSRLDLRADPRLRFGFDRLVDRIYELELAALRDLAAAQEAEEVPAAIDELASLTFPPDPALRARVEQEMRSLSNEIPITLNERVLGMLNFFQTSRGRRIIRNGLRRAGRYREMITSTLEEEGVPRDLMWKVQAESAFQPHARSRARAVGLWQFMAFRAREYGLRVDWWVDERRDPVKATRAAARHLHDLYEQFGDWLLVMAAYNSGPGRVRRAQRRAGGQADYWTLVKRRLLPRETRNHIPIILAVMLIAKNPARYGIEVEPDPPLAYETVPVDKPIDLRRVAKALEIDVRTLRGLNPHLVRGVTPVDYPGFELYVPPGTAGKLQAALPGIPKEERVYWPRHRVRRGDTLSHLAQRYRTSAYGIAQANGMSLRTTIYPGQVLVIPSGSSGRSRARTRRRSSGRAQRWSEGALVYRVRRGDTLSEIAARHGVSPQSLARANGMSLRTVSHPGDRLAIPERVGSGRAARPAGRQVVHRVRRGDTLWELSRRYGVSVSRLRRANPYLLSRQLRAGDRLLIPQ
ncbi:MAG: LysM peptidoglycan-binding domain-containing protein [Terriglobia bacterium]